MNWRLAGGPARVVQKNIEDIVEGDRVIAWDDETGQQVVRPVVRTFENVSDHLRVVRVRGSDGTTQEIKTTNEHPFWVPDKGWVSAKDLETGTRLVQSDGQSAQVELTSLDVKPKGTCVYNFEVVGAHNYYVAAQGVRGPPVLVHNKCATEGVSELLEKGGKAKQAAKAVHKNCLESTAMNHGYVIFNKETGEIYKFGISATDLLKCDKSARAQAQISKLATMEGIARTEIETLVLIKNVGKRADIVKWEKNTVGFFKKMDHELPYNIRPKGEWPLQ